MKSVCFTELLFINFYYMLVCICNTIVYNVFGCATAETTIRLALLPIYFVYLPIVLNSIAESSSEIVPELVLQAF